MANNWKYATLGQRERLSRIREGDFDVYNTEKERNKLLKEQQSKLGINTRVVDDWDATIDNAFNKSQQAAKKKALPSYGGGKYAQINSELNSTIRKLRNERNESIEAAKSDAESALNYLTEWLANNGYSNDGKFAGESKEKLESALESVLKSIRDEYDEQVKNTRKRFLSMVM